MEGINSSYLCALPPLGPTRSLEAHPFRRARVCGRFPLVVYVHGGGWLVDNTRLSGAFANFPNVLASLAAQGYVVASVNYRAAHPWCR